MICKFRGFDPLCCQVQRKSFGGGIPSPEEGCHDWTFFWRYRYQSISQSQFVLLENLMECKGRKVRNRFVKGHSSFSSCSPNEGQGISWHQDFIQMGRLRANADVWNKLWVTFWVNYSNWQRKGHCLAGKWWNFQWESVAFFCRLHFWFYERTSFTKLSLGFVARRRELSMSGKRTDGLCQVGQVFTTEL